MNNRGFSTISFILFLPIALMLSFAGFWSLWFINQTSSLENICHEEVLKAQDQLIQANNSIMRLNTTAYGLIIEKRALTAAILASPPPAAAAIAAKRKLVIAAQYTLKNLQSGFLIKGNISSKMKLLILRKRFRNKLRAVKNFFNPKMPLPYNSIYLDPKISKIKKDIRDIAPTYKRSTNHSYVQSITAQWKLPMQIFLPPWLNKKLRIKKYWEGQCSARPKKGVRKWFAAIGEGKLSLKQSSSAFF